MVRARRISPRGWHIYTSSSKTMEKGIMYIELAKRPFSSKNKESSRGIVVGSTT
jgi:hypothetical protein